MKVETKENGRKFYLYGAGYGGERCLKLLKECVKIEGIIETDNSRIGDLWNGYPITSLEHALAVENCYILISVVTDTYKKEIENVLCSHGLEYNKDYCFYEDISDFAYKFSDAIIEDYMELYVTGRCTLRCKECSLMIPYIKSPKDILIDDILKSIDNYFKKIDKVKEIHILGGEPFLYNGLEEITEYIYKNYEERFLALGYVTNGTVMPNEELIRTMKKNKVSVIISEYPMERVVLLREKLISVLKDNDITCYNIAYSEWHSLFDNPYEKLDMEKGGLKSCLSCDMPCRTLYDSKIFYCAVDCAAKRNQIIESNGNGEIDLEKNEKAVIAKLLYEYREVKFDENNYPEFCQNCYGYPGIVKRTIPVAEQLENN